MNAKSLKINKKSIDITISIEINEFVGKKEAIIKLLELAISNGESPIIKKQVFDEFGGLKTTNSHTFF